MSIRSSACCASKLAAILGLAALLTGSPAAADEEGDRNAAVAAAKEEATHWLEALDAGRHAESWNDAAAVMKEGRNEQDWIRDIASPRESLGKSIMRELQRTEFSTAVRGAPTGQYVTLTYLTQFAKAPPVSETILLTLESSRWRIAGYSIERAPEQTAPAPAPADKNPAPGIAPKPRG